MLAIQDDVAAPVDATVPAVLAIEAGVPRDGSPRSLSGSRPPSVIDSDDNFDLSTRAGVHGGCKITYEDYNRGTL